MTEPRIPCPECGTEVIMHGLKGHRESRICKARQFNEAVKRGEFVRISGHGWREQKKILVAAGVKLVEADVLVSKEASTSKQKPRLRVFAPAWAIQAIQFYASEQAKGNIANDLTAPEFIKMMNDGALGKTLNPG